LSKAENSLQLLALGRLRFSRSKCAMSSDLTFIMNESGTSLRDHFGALQSEEIKSHDLFAKLIYALYGPTRSHHSAARGCLAILL